MRRSNEHLMEAFAEMSDEDIRKGVQADTWHTARGKLMAKEFLEGKHDRAKIKAAKAKREKEEEARMKAELKESLEAHSSKVKTKVVPDGEGAPRSEKERTVVVEQPKPVEKLDVQEGAPAFRKDEGKPVAKHTNPNVEQPKSNKGK